MMGANLNPFLKFDKKLYYEPGRYKDLSTDRSISMHEDLENLLTEKSGERTWYAKQGYTNSFQKFAARQRMRAEGKTPEPDALEIMVRAYGVSLNDPTLTVKRWLETDGLNTLWPAYMMTMIAAEQFRRSMISDWLAVMVPTNATTVKKLYLERNKANRKMRWISKGGEIPKIKAKTSEGSVDLKKVGAALELPYEDAAGLPLAIFNQTLKACAADLEDTQMNDILNVGLNGDGNSNGILSANVKKTVESGKAGIQDLIRLGSCLPQPYKPRVACGDLTACEPVWTAMGSIQNPAAQMSNMGANIPKVERWDNDFLPSDYILTCDPDFAFAYFYNDNLSIEEVDRVILRQVSVTTITRKYLVTKQDNNAVGALDTVWT